MRQPGGHEQPAVRTQRKRIWPDARQFHLRSGGSDELVDRRDKTICAVADNSGRGFKIVGENLLEAESNKCNQPETDEKTAFHCGKECPQSAAGGKSRYGEISL